MCWYFIIMTQSNASLRPKRLFFTVRNRCVLFALRSVSRITRCNVQNVYLFITLCSAYSITRRIETYILYRPCVLEYIVHVCLYAGWLVSWFASYLNTLYMYENIESFAISTFIEFTFKIND